MSDAAFVIDSPQAMRYRLKANEQEAMRRNALAGMGYRLTSADLAYKAAREREIAQHQADQHQRDTVDRMTGKLVDLAPSEWTVVG